MGACRSSNRDRSHPEEFVVPGKTPPMIWEEHIRRYQFAGDYVERKSVLDVACGVGYGTAHLAGQGPGLVVGGDIAREQLMYAQSQYTGPRTHFARVNAECLPFRDARFDVVVCFETVEHLENPMRFLAECRRVLRPGGLLLCSTPMRLSYRPPWLPRPVNPYHASEYTIGDLLGLIGTDFRDMQIYGQSAFDLVTVLRKYVEASAGWALSHVPRLKSKLNKAAESLVSSHDDAQTVPVPAIRPIGRLFPGFPSYLIVTAIRRN
jgi:SAM-dependent methyltransferase